MKRRTFITLLGGAAASEVLPRASRAQQRVPVIGFLHSQSADGYGKALAGFRQGLKETGFVEGENVAIEFRWAHGRLDQLPALAADLISRRVALVFATGGPEPAQAAKAATSTIPIVFSSGADPIRSGLVASLNRPGGNATGVALLTGELGAKRVGLLHELVPRAMSMGYLTTARSLLQSPEPDQIRAAARALGRQMIVAEVRDERDFEAAFATLIERGIGALVVGTDALFTSNRDKLLPLVKRHNIPTIYGLREFAVDGGLMSYAGSLADALRLGGLYVGRILKGTKPDELPVQQATKLEFVINLKTASALGLEYPPSLLAIADEVIE